MWNYVLNVVLDLKKIKLWTTQRQSTANLEGALLKAWTKKWAKRFWWSSTKIEPKHHSDNLNFWGLKWSLTSVNNIMYIASIYIYITYYMIYIISNIQPDLLVINSLFCQNRKLFVIVKGGWPCAGRSQWFATIIMYKKRDKIQRIDKYRKTPKPPNIQFVLSFHEGICCFSQSQLLDFAVFIGSLCRLQRPLNQGLKTQTFALEPLLTCHCVGKVAFKLGVGCHKLVCHLGWLRWLRTKTIPLFIQKWYWNRGCYSM